MVAVGENLGEFLRVFGTQHDLALADILANPVRVVARHPVRVCHNAVLAQRGQEVIHVVLINLSD